MGLHAGNRSRPAYSGQARFRLPPEVTALFAPRPPLEFKPTPRRKKLRQMSGVAELTARLKSAKADDAKQPVVADGASDAAGAKQEEFITPAKRRAMRAAADQAKVLGIVEARRKEYDPRADIEGKKTRNPFNTLFVGRMSKATMVSALRAEFEAYGPVVRVVIPNDRRGLPRGYGFIEYADERSLKAAYRDADGRRLDGMRIIVDVERARTVKDWLPNRLDGIHNSAARAAKRGSGRVVSNPSPPLDSAGRSRRVAAPPMRYQ
jgi:U1 small nuclear ribonucleoprotein 70kDa